MPPTPSVVGQRPGQQGGGLNQRSGLGVLDLFDLAEILGDSKEESDPVETQAILMEMLGGIHIPLSIVELIGTSETPYGQRVRMRSKDELLRCRAAVQVGDRMGDKLVELWGKRRDDTRQQSNYRNLFWELFQRTYEGRAPESVSRDEMLVPIGHPNWYENGITVRFNRARPLVEEISAELTQINGVLNVSARSGSDEDRAAARTAQRMVLYWEDAREVKREKHRASMMAPIYGTWYGKVWWDEDAFATIKDPLTGDISRGRFGDVKMELVRPSCLLVPNGLRELDEAPWMIYQRRRPRSWMEQHHPEALLYISETDTTTFEDEESFDPRFWWLDDYAILMDEMAMDGPDNLSPEERGCPYLISECYERQDHPLLGEFWTLTVICAGYVLFHGPYGARDDSGQIVIDPETGNFTLWDNPFVMGRYYYSPDRFFGQGVIRDALYCIRALAWLDALVWKLSTDSGNVALATQIGSNHTPIPNRGWIELKYNDKKPELLGLGGSPIPILEAVRFYQDQLDRLSLRPDVTRGKSPAARSGKGMEILAEQARGAFDGIRERMNQFWISIYSKGLKLISQMYGQARVFGIDETDGVGAFEFSRADIAGHTDVRVTHAPIYGTSRSERLAYVQTMIEIGLMSQAEARQITQAGSTTEVVTTEQLQERAAQTIISKICHKMPDEKAAEIVQEIQTVFEEFDKTPPAKLKQMVELGGNMALENEMDEAVEHVLLKNGIGISSYHSEYVGIHKRITGNYLLCVKADALAPDRKYLLEQRYLACQRHERRIAAAMAAQQAPQQQQAA
jgi:hypothetical protein